jgi:hypothetical protein
MMAFAQEFLCTSSVACFLKQWLGRPNSLLKLSDGVKPLTPFATLSFL